jgi:small subunit ribosomal protein S20
VPNTKSAKKMVRVAERRRLRNRPIRSSVRTYIRKAERAIGTTDESAASAVVTAIRALDKAVNKGVIHRNNAARRKSRLMKKLNRANASASSSTT